MTNLQTEPEGLILMLSALHTPDVVDEFVDDLRMVVHEVRDGLRTRPTDEGAFGIY